MTRKRGVLERDVLGTCERIEADRSHSPCAEGIKNNPSMRLEDVLTDITREREWQDRRDSDEKGGQHDLESANSSLYASIQVRA